MVAILATGVARLFDLSQEGGLRDDGGLFGETVFVLGESYIIFHFSLFLSLYLSCLLLFSRGGVCLPRTPGEQRWWSLSKMYEFNNLIIGGPLQIPI